MKLFVDHIRARWKQPLEDYRNRFPDNGESLVYWTLNAPVFVNGDAIERVARGEVELEQLPSFAPPYGNMFIESNIPFVDVLKEGEGRISVRIGARMAMAVFGYDKHHPELMPDDNGDGFNPNCRPLDADQHRWTLNLHLYTETHLHHPRQFARVTVFLGLDGKPLAMLNGDNIGYSYVELEDDFMAELRVYDRLTSAEQNEAIWYEFAETALNAGMYTLGMLHCRNIGTQEFAPRAAEAHKFEKKHGIPMARYKVLKITGKGRDAGELIGMSTGRRMPLHWVRGHWRTYTDDAPLFGTVTGTFYVHEHIRGSLKAGAVAKDYEVKP